MKYDHTQKNLRKALCYTTDEMKKAVAKAKKMLAYTLLHDTTSESIEAIEKEIKETDTKTTAYIIEKLASFKLHHTLDEDPSGLPMGGAMAVPEDVFKKMVSEISSESSKKEKKRSNGEENKAYN